MSEFSKMDKNPLEIEFEQIEKNDLWGTIYSEIRDNASKNTKTMDEAKKLQNRVLNRYRDVNPYDHSRVVLKRDGFNYINASHVRVPRAGRNYILCQGPLLHTISHFWLMIWEQDSDIIVMLNNIVEKNQVKCAQYWPPRETENMVFSDVGLKIELFKIRDFFHYIVRFIKLTDLKTNDAKTVIQFHYTAWPDFGVPKNPNTFLKFLHALQKGGNLERQTNPPVVHCSAGIGRSGTFCLVDSCLLMMRNEGPDKVDFKQVLTEMRKFRMGLIQTPEQLRFSYLAILKGYGLDWEADIDDFLKDDSSPTADPESDESRDFLARVNGAVDCDHPPTPPPRTQSLEFGKPLPSLPADVSSSDNETELGGFEPKLDDVSASRLGEMRKRKHMEVLEKSKRVSEKVDEMIKKQTDAENRKRYQRKSKKLKKEDSDSSD